MPHTPSREAETTTGCGSSGFVGCVGGSVYTAQRLTTFGNLNNPYYQGLARSAGKAGKGFDVRGLAAGHGRPRRGPGPEYSPVVGGEATSTWGVSARTFTGPPPPFRAGAGLGSPRRLYRGFPTHRHSQNPDIYTLCSSQEPARVPVMPGWNQEFLTNRL